MAFHVFQASRHFEIFSQVLKRIRAIFRNRLHGCRNLRLTQLLRVLTKEFLYLAGLHARSGIGLFAAGSYSRLFHLLGGRQYFLGAVSQPIYLFGLRRTAIIAIKGGIDAPQHGLQRDTRILPCANQFPVKGRNLQPSSTPLAEMHLHLGEVVEVILHILVLPQGKQAANDGKERGMSRRAFLLLAGGIALPDDAQAIKGQQVIHSFDVFGMLANELGQTTSGDDLGIRAKLFQEALYNAIHQSEIAEEQSGLDAGHSVGADDLAGLANIYEWKTGSMFE